MARFKGKRTPRGNATTNVPCTLKGEAGYFKGYLELPNGKTLKIDFNPENVKEDRNGNPVCWVTATVFSSNGGGNRSGGGYQRNGGGGGSW